MNFIHTDNVLTKLVNNFHGVSPIDLLPSTLIKTSIIVINPDKHYLPDSHWVAVYFSFAGYAEYFDSYGLTTFKYEIMAYLHRHSISWAFNRHRLQGLTSNICGHYCWLYALHSIRVQSMTSYVDMFSLLATPVMIKGQCACSVLSLERVPLAVGWKRSSRASRRY